MENTKKVFSQVIQKYSEIEGLLSKIDLETWELEIAKNKIQESLLWIKKSERAILQQKSRLS